MDRLDGLNPAQREAVTTHKGPLLVLAGAGTGKTRVITVRMAELIRSGVRPDTILSVTFTNKAAKEMQERAAAILGKRKRIKPVVTTFHSFCVKVLRVEIERLHRNLPSHALLLLDGAYADYIIDPDFEEFSSFGVSLQGLETRNALPSHLFS